MPIIPPWTGLVIGTDGNVSARVAPGSDWVVIKPSGVPYDVMRAEHMVLCTVDGTPAPGELYKPSSEINLHTGIYRARPDVQAVVHVHSMYAGALACTRRPLPYGHYSVSEVAEGDDPAVGVACCPYHCYGTQALGDACVAALGANAAVLLANHGSVTVGPDLDAALYNARRLERECEMYYRAVQLPGGPALLTRAELAAMRDRNKTYGQVDEGEVGEGHGLGGGGGPARSVCC